jgi:hypothetical protein
MGGKELRHLFFFKKALFMVYLTKLSVAQTSYIASNDRKIKE